MLPSCLPSLPKSVRGFVRRYEADTKRIQRHPTASAMLIRSWTLLQAEGLGQPRFEEVLRNLNLPKRSRAFAQHRLLAKNAIRLLPLGWRLPADVALLCRIAELEPEALSRFLTSASRFYARKTLDEIQGKSAKVSRVESQTL